MIGADQWRCGYASSYSFVGREQTGLAVHSMPASTHAAGDLGAVPSTRELVLDGRGASAILNRVYCGRRHRGPGCSGDRCGVSSIPLVTTAVSAALVLSASPAFAAPGEVFDVRGPQFRLGCLTAGTFAYPLSNRASAIETADGDADLNSGDAVSVSFYSHASTP